MVKEAVFTAAQEAQIIEIMRDLQAEDREAYHKYLEDTRDDREARKRR